MKRGQRKLCDIHDDRAAAAQLRGAVEGRLIALDIPWQSSIYTDRKGRDYRRYFVGLRDLPRALEELPLELRGFKPVGQAAPAAGKGGAK